MGTGNLGLRTQQGSGLPVLESRDQEDLCHRVTAVLCDLSPRAFLTWLSSYLGGVPHTSLISQSLSAA